MDGKDQNQSRKPPPDVVVAAELFEKLPADTQTTIKELMKSILSKM